MTLVMILCTLLAVPALASAQARKGDAEVAVGGSLFSILSDGYNSSSGQFNFGVGRFLTDRFEVAVAPTIRISASTRQGQPEFRIGNTIISPAVPGGTSWDVDAGMSTRAQYFFGAQASKVKPYLGGALTVQSFKTPEGGSAADNLYTGALFGVRSYLSEKTAVDFNGQMGFQASDPSAFQLLTMNVGFTYLF
jgi:outer membrane protein W